MQRSDHACVCSASLFQGPEGGKSSGGRRAHNPYCKSVEDSDAAPKMSFAQESTAALTPVVRMDHTAETPFPSSATRSPGLPWDFCSSTSFSSSSYRFTRLCACVDRKERITGLIWSHLGSHTHPCMFMFSTSHVVQQPKLSVTHRPVQQPKLSVKLQPLQLSST